MPCHIKREYAVQVFQVDELMIICKGCLGSDAHDLADLQRTGRIQACKKIEQEFVVRLQEETESHRNPGLPPKGSSGGHNSLCAAVKSVKYSRTGFLHK